MHWQVLGERGVLVSLTGYPSSPPSQELEAVAGLVKGSPGHGAHGPHFERLASTKHPDTGAHTAPRAPALHCSVGKYGSSAHGGSGRAGRSLR